MSGKPEWDQSLGKDKVSGEFSWNALALACLGCVLTSWSGVQLSLSHLQMCHFMLYSQWFLAAEVLLPWFLKSLLLTLFLLWACPS